MPTDKNRLSVSTLLRPTSIKGESTIYYRIRIANRTRLISSHIRIRTSQWNGTQPVVPYLRSRLDCDLSRLRRLLLSASPSRLDAIISDFRSHAGELTLTEYLDSCIDTLRSEHRYATAHNYRALRSSLSLYAGGQLPLLREVDRQWVEGYYLWLLSRPLSPNTVSFYLRILKAVIHKAQRQSLHTADNPFLHIRLPHQPTRKRAISGQLLQNIASLDLDDAPRMRLARDIFLFSFMTRGMPFVDIAYLTDANLSGDILTYRRRKTGAAMRVRLEPAALQILRRYAAPGRRRLFPLISEFDTEMCKERIDGCISKEYQEYKKALQCYNLHLRRIGEMAGVPARLTSYVSRHSWATLQQRSHVPLSVISASLGHHSERTTLVYLAGIESSEIDEANRRLLADLFP